MSSMILHWPLTSQMKWLWQLRYRKGREVILMEFLGAQSKKAKRFPNNKERIKIVFVTSIDAFLPYSFALENGCSNRTMEYEILIADLSLLDRSRSLKIYGDLKLLNITRTIYCLRSWVNSLPRVSNKAAFVIREGGNYPCLVGCKRLSRCIIRLQHLLPSLRGESLKIVVYLSNTYGTIILVRLRLNYR